MTWLAILALCGAGVFLSACFSGSETGFYRATRLRLALDAFHGGLVSKMLLWLSNRPSMFVATTLVGNNLANYLVSLAVVMASGVLFGNSSRMAELVTPVLFTPVLFVYGELLPKYVFLHAPNLMLRWVGPLLAVCFVLFLPVSALLWWLNRLLQRLTGPQPEELRWTLAGQDLSRLFEEGGEAGILVPAQRRLARGITALSDRPIGEAVRSLAAVPRARANMSRADVLGLARRYRIAVVPVESSEGPRRLVGYVRVSDLALSSEDRLAPVRPLLRLPTSTTYLAALARMQNEKEELAEVDDQGEPLGIVHAEDLRARLLAADR